MGPNLVPHLGPMATGKAQFFWRSFIDWGHDDLMNPDGKLAQSGHNVSNQTNYAFK